MAIQSRKKLRDSGLLFSIMLVVIFTLIPYLLHGRIFIYPVGPAIVISIFSFASPYRLSQPLDYWFKLGNFLGKVNSTLILGIFFYFILVPSSFVRYLIKFLSLRKKSHFKSYYRYNIAKSSKYDSSLKDQY